MKLVASPIQAANTISRIQRLMEVPRTEGVHVSDLIFCLRKTKARSGDRPLSPSDTLMFAVGRAIQDYITGGDPEVPLVVDDIHGTVDWVVDGYPWEVKATYASAARDIRGTPHYFDQLGAYCYMLGVATGYLAVLYLNGYYDRKTPGERAVLKVWEVTFDANELEVHWRQLRERLDLWQRAVTWQDLPIEHHWTWECGYCPLHGECPGGKGSYSDSWGPR